jgi:hypothetical protein
MMLPRFAVMSVGDSMAGVSDDPARRCRSSDVASEENDVITGRLPTFLVIGAMKAGTSSLYRYLTSHPQVFMPERKEARFFNEMNWKKGVDWYRGLFAGAADHVAVGEASPTYTAYPLQMQIPDRIASVLPDVRLLYLVREPLARIRSHYLMSIWTGQESLPIDEAIIHNPLYLYQTQYAMQLDRYLRLFPEESIMVVRSEALRDARDETMRRVFTFLGVDPEWRGESFDQEFNTSASRRDVTFTSIVKHGIRRNREMENVPIYRMGFRFIRRSWNRVKARNVANVMMAPETEEFVRDRIRDDVDRLRRFMPDGFDGWGIA